MGGGGKTTTREETVSGPSSTQALYSKYSTFFTVQDPRVLGMAGQVFDPATLTYKTLNEVKPDSRQQGEVLAHQRITDYLGGLGLQKLPTGEVYAPEGTSQDTLDALQAAYGRANTEGGLYTDYLDPSIPIRTYGGPIVDTYGLHNLDYQEYSNRFAAGELSTDAATRYQAVQDMVNNPTFTSTEQIEQIYATANAEGAFTIPDPPPIQQVVSELLAGLPPGIHTFINNIIQDSSAEGIGAQVTDFAEALRTQLAGEAEKMIEMAGAKFASQLGTTSSGAYMSAVGQIMLEGVKDINTKVAAAKIDMTKTLLDARNTGIAVIQQLFNAGDNEAARQLSADMKEVELEAAKQQVKIGAHLTLQRDLNQYMVNVYGLDIEEHRTREQSRMEKVKFFQDLVYKYATTGPIYQYGTKTSKSTTPGTSPISFAFSYALPAIGSIFGGPAGGAAGAAVTGGN